jgi:hypothetical protein
MDIEIKGVRLELLRQLDDLVGRLGKKPASGFGRITLYVEDGNLTRVEDLNSEIIKKK